MTSLFRSFLLVLSLVMLSCAALPAQQIPDLDFDEVRSLVVQHDGRWMPLDTLARDVVRRVTGRRSWRDSDPVGVLLAWVFDPAGWMQTPLVTVSNAELRRELGLDEDRTAYSFKELIEHPTLRPLMQRVERIQGRDLDPLEKKVSEIRETLILLQQVWRGQILKPIPAAKDPMGTWHAIPEPWDVSHPELEPVKAAWERMRRAFLAADAAAFDQGLLTLRKSLSGLVAAYEPDAKIIETELFYNRLEPFRMAWIVMGLGVFASLAAIMLRRRWTDVLAVLCLALGFVFVTWGLSLRWRIAGRIPASNMYESLLFLGWGMAAFSLIALVVQRNRMVPLTASFMGALALMLSDVLPINPFIRPIPPVLADTMWMSIHVPLIMTSYAILALALLIAHVQLFFMAFRPERAEAIARIDRMHHWYVHIGSVLLAIGIITGSMWASSSWGRYWGWDPKEVWSLAAFFGYMAILHIRLDRQFTPPWMKALGGLLAAGVFGLVFSHLAPDGIGQAAALFAGALVLAVLVLARGTFATPIKSILCFWLIVMTYVGVNYVLGTGLHSYGFGSGAVVRSMKMLVGGDLALIVLLVLIRRWKLRKSAKPPAVRRPLPA